MREGDLQEEVDGQEMSHILKHSLDADDEMADARDELDEEEQRPHDQDDGEGLPHVVSNFRCLRWMTRFLFERQTQEETDGSHDTYEEEG